MKYLEIDCEAREEITTMRRLIRDCKATVVSETTIEGDSFSHLIWLTGSDEALHEVVKFFEPGATLEEAMVFIDSDTRRYREEHSDS